MHQPTASRRDSDCAGPGAVADHPAPQGDRTIAARQCGALAVALVLCTEVLTLRTAVAVVALTAYAILAEVVR